MPYKKEIEELEWKLADLKFKQRNSGMKIDESQKVYLIEYGIDGGNKEYMCCEDVTGHSLSNIDSLIMEDNETNEHLDFKAWSFRLSSKPEEEYGLE